MPSPRPSKNSGFALVIALSLMAFVLLLLLSITTLVQVETRSVKQTKAGSQARQNALLGLQEALGTLQSTAGPDQRVTATGSLWTTPKLGTEHLVGVWSSEDVNGDGTFQRWLVSRANPSETENISFISNPMAIKSDGSAYYSTAADHVVLVGRGSVAQDPNHPDYPNDPMQGVVAQKKAITDSNNQTSGNYAWWVGDEGGKAKINQIDPYSHDLIDQSNSAWSADHAWAGLSSQSMQGSSLAALQNFDTQNTAGDDTTAQKMSRILNRDQVPLLTFDGSDQEKSTATKQQFHSTTTTSLGLQTNVKDGGLKRDLSLLFELDSADYDDPFSAFMTTITADGLDYTGAPGPKSNIPLIFKQDIGSFGDGVIYGPSWDMLRDYYRLYKGVAASLQASSSTPTLNKDWVHTYSPGKAWFLKQGGAANESDAWRQTLGLGAWRDSNAIEAAEANKQTNASHDSSTPLPVVRPTQGAYLPYLSRSTIFTSTIAKPNGDYYDIDVVLQPYIAMHNPYNVTVAAPKMRFLKELSRFEIAVRRDAIDPSKGWSITRPFRTGGASGGNEGNVYNNSGDHWSLSGTALKKESKSGYTFSESARELTFYVNETTYAPGEIKLFVPDGQVNFVDREVDLVEFGGSYDPLNGVYFNLDNYDYYVDHDGDSDTPRELLLQNIPRDEDITLRIVMDGWPSMAYEVYNEALDAYDTAGSYYHRSDKYHGNAELHRSISDLEDEKGDDYGPYTNLVDLFVNSPVPHLVVDDFVKPIQHSESLIAPTNPAKPTAKPFPNFTITNPLAASFSTAGTAGREYNGYGNLIHTNVETFEGSAGSGAHQLLYTGDKGTWGHNNGDAGAARTILLEVPSAPLQSIGQLQHASLNAMPNYPALSVGNSFRSPHLQNASSTYHATTENYGGQSREFVFYDQNYLINEALWDGYFFSSIAPQPNDNSYSAQSPGTSVDPFDADIPAVVQSFINGDPALANSRMRYMESPPIGGSAAADLVDFRNSAQHLAVDGAFNINSTSVDAWTVFLAGYRDVSIQYYDGNNFATEAPNNKAAFLRQSLPGGSSAPSSTSIASNSAWAGFLKLTDAELRTLAQQIVIQIQSRAAFRGSATVPTPALSLAQFVNRILTTTAPYSNSGTLQGAIEQTNINHSRLTANNEFSTAAYNSDGNSYTDTSYTMNAANVSPLSLTQGDILQAIAPAISARSDTFMIRSYGETIDINGNVSKAWCEGVFQRTTEKINDQFGRKFKAISFRWLSPDEV